MRSIFILPFALMILSFKTPHDPLKTMAAKVDTTIITHELDGMVTEWPAEKFEQDQATKIKYAVDNDGQNLYVAMIVSEFPTQMKMTRMGMNLFLDVKGKKKENKGIEFPVKSE